MNALGSTANPFRGIHFVGLFGILMAMLLIPLAVFALNYGTTAAVVVAIAVYVYSGVCAAVLTASVYVGYLVGIKTQLLGWTFRGSVIVSTVVLTILLVLNALFFKLWYKQILDLLSGVLG